MTIATRNSQPVALSSEDLADLLQETLDRQGRVRLTARGSSMWPAIPPNVELDVAPLDRKPARGDIVAARNPGGRLLIHRVVRTGPGWAELRGDAELRGGQRLPMEDVLGLASRAGCDSWIRQVVRALWRAAASVPAPTGLAADQALRYGLWATGKFMRLFRRAAVR